MLLNLFVAYILGLVSGAVTMALLAAVKRSDEEFEEIWKQYLKDKEELENESG